MPIYYNNVVGMVNGITFSINNNDDGLQNIIVSTYICCVCAQLISKGTHTWVTTNNAQWHRMFISVR